MRKILTRLKTVNALLLICCLLLLSPATWAKPAAQQAINIHISITIKDELLLTALNKIEQQANVKFSYNPADVGSIKVNQQAYANQSVGNILKKLLVKTGLTFREVNDGIVVYKKGAEPKTEKIGEVGDGTRMQELSVQPAQVTVRGRVSDAQGPLAGVTVTVEGSNKSVPTSINGDYSINAPATGALLFSFTGYVRQRIAINNRATIDVVMAVDSKSLNEVVVVGYGTQKKSDVTGSITSINEKALRDVPSSNLAQALQGQGSGVDIQRSGGNSHPGSTPSILIRGVRSAQASNSPLFVVDGIPYTGSLQDLNVDDVASVEVLKDASATAIYGSRGANGVILVTTKRGKTGEPVLTYSGYGGFSKPLGHYNVMDAQQYALLKKWAAVNGTFDSKTGAPKYAGIDDPTILTSGIFATEELQGLQSSRNTDWQDLIYKTGVTINHQVGLSGGTERTQYDIAAGYYNETGIYYGQSFIRYTLKLSIDQKLGKRFKVGLSALNNLSNVNGENANPLGQALRASPMASPYDNSGNLVGYVPGSANQVWNPLANFVPGAVVETRKRFGTFTTAYFEADLLPGLKYRFNGGAEIKPSVYGNFYAKATTNNQGSLSTANNQSSFGYNYTLENILTYDRTFAQKHHINFTGLYSLQENQTQSNSFNYNNILADVIQYYNPSYGANLTGSGSYAKYDLISYMGRLNYGYNDKYLLTLTLRSDGSSKLAPGNKYHVFPSAALAWNVMKESFIKQDNNILSNLKLRLSYGSVGNAAIDPYQTLGGLSSVTYNYGTTNTTGSYPTSAPNPNLTWEYTATLNAGIDFGFFKDRVTGSIDAYHEYTKDLLLPQSLPPTSGIPNRIATNIGKSENKGIEVTINTVNIAAHGRNTVGWSTNFNIAFNRGKMTQLASGVLNDISNNLFVGHSQGSIFDYKKIGIWQNTHEDSLLAKKYNLTLTQGGSVIGTVKVADVNNDGKIDANDRTLIGSDQPFCNGGITNRVTYRGLDFTVVGAYRIGGTLTSAIYQSGSFLNTFQGNYNNLAVNFWTPSNHENYFPKPNAATTNTPYSSTLSYFSASYLKIRSISLGYTFSPALMKTLGIRSLRVYATAENRFILFSPYRNDFHGIDPETSGKLAEDTPSNWSMLFGANVTF